METPTLSYAAAYRAASEQIGGCPIEAGFARLADHECPCPAGRLPNDATPPCGCFPMEWETRHLPVLVPDLMGALADAETRVAHLTDHRPDRAHLVNCVADAICELGRTPTRTEYDAVAAKYGWPSAPSAGWRSIRTQARLQHAEAPASAAA